MSEKVVVVEARQFDELCRHYSGDLLGKNKCSAVSFANRLWTVTGIVKGGAEAASVDLHELVLPDQYQGPTGSYPFDTDGVFYKGQAVKVRGRAFVMSGRSLLVLCKDEDESPEHQLDLLGWREERRTSGNGEHKKPKVKKKAKKSRSVRTKDSSGRVKQRAKPPRKTKRR